MSQEDFIITVYCLLDDMLSSHVSGFKLRSRGFPPKLTDLEVLTMEVVGEFMGIDTDKGLWQYFKTHWAQWFPDLGSRANFVKQAANLWRIKQLIQETLGRRLGSVDDILHMADGFPIPVCKFKRAGFSPLFKGLAAYGYCASKSETYYGFKGNLMINSQGVISGITITAAPIDERESLWEIVGDVKGVVLADKGLIGQTYQQQLQRETGINLQTPMRHNMADTRGKDANSWLVSTRRLVETVIGQLTEQFNIQKVRARDTWHLTNRIARKVLSHTVGIAINYMTGNPPLQLEKIITA